MFTFAKEINMTPEALNAGNRAGDSILEKLRAALVSLGKHRFVFMDWSQCTCGHIYRAAKGRGTRNDMQVYNSEDETFGALLKLVAEANHLPTWMSHDVAGYRSAVSNGTTITARKMFGLSEYGDPSNTQLKAAAIHLIERAIEFEEERNEQARLALIGS